MRRTVVFALALLTAFALLTSAFALNDTQLSLDDAEAVYVRETPVLKALCAFSSTPYCEFIDGIAVGVIPELVSVIEHRSGLSFDIVQADSPEEARDIVSRGEVDIVLDAGHNFDWAGQYGYALSEPYVSATFSMLKLRNEKPRTEHIAVREAPAIGTVYARRYYYPERLMYFGTAEECVEAVLAGECDSAILTAYMAERIVHEDVRNRYISSTLPSAGEPICVAVKADLSPYLLSVINKAIASFEDGLADRCVARHTAYSEPKMTPIAYLYRNPVVVIGALLLALFAAFMLALLINRSRRAKVEHRRAEEEKRRNELLSDALAAAERADTAKSQFLSRVSHEMRTPLNAIIGFLTLAKDGDTAQLKQYLTHSEVAAKQLLAVINDVLDMSAIESGKMKLAHAPFDFKQLIHSITNIYLPQCYQKGVRFETRMLAPIDDWLVGDQLRLNQILMNLLSNAVKFTDEGSILFSINILDKKDRKVFIRFVVSDTGCGMSEDMLSRLFKSFEQESALTAQKYGGSGLGMSIVKNLVSLMEGAIRVESTPDEGTTFTIDLPFEQSDISVREHYPRSVEKLRVLAIDDEAAEREYLAVVLKHIGVRYTVVKDGDTALKELDAAAEAGDVYNICIVDWQMPDMDGYEVTKRIRAKYSKDVMVIIVSAYEHYQMGSSAQEAGANLFITKPLFQSSLFDLFMSMTGGRIGKKKSDAIGMRKFTDKHALLAEDNVMNRMVAVGLVSKLGITCDVAENGRIALDMFTASEPGFYDVILMDMQMPEMDGLESTQAIRASGHPDARDIPIIALTANAFNEDIARALSSGMNDHVAKPISTETLLKALEKAFEGRTASNDA